MCSAGNVAPESAQGRYRVANWWLDELLDAGLAHEAAATYAALPAAIRSRMDGKSCGELPGIGGTQVGWYLLDLRLGLVAARLLDGDAPGGARAAGRDGAFVATLVTRWTS